MEESMVGWSLDDRYKELMAHIKALSANQVQLIHTQDILISKIAALERKVWGMSPDTVIANE